MTAREERLLEVAREVARFLAYKTYGQHDRVFIARRLHAALLEYDDVEPVNLADRDEWLARQAAQ